MCARHTSLRAGSAVVLGAGVNFVLQQVFCVLCVCSQKANSCIHNNKYTNKLLMSYVLCLLCSSEWAVFMTGLLARGLKSSTVVTYIVLPIEAFLIGHTQALWASFLSDGHSVVPVCKLSSLVRALSPVKHRGL